MEKLDNRLILQAINEIAEHIGFSIYNPISLGLVCLNYEIEYDEQDKLFLEFHKILNEKSFDDLDFEIFKKCINKVCPKSKDFADIVIASIIIAFAKCRIPELLPFTEDLIEYFIKE